MNKKPGKLSMLHQSLSDSVKIISIDRKELLSELSDIARRIRAKHPEVRSVRVFGSIARGDQVGTSDVDVLIVLDDHASDKELMERIRLFYPYFDLPIGVDLLIYTKAEIAKRLQTGDAFIKQIWTESLTI